VTIDFIEYHHTKGSLRGTTAATTELIEFETRWKREALSTGQAGGVFNRRMFSSAICL
jgi:hypothetical protein